MAINYLDILIEYNELTLPSVGTFSVLHHSAVIDKEQQLIFPPYKQIKYSSGTAQLEYSKEIAAYLEMKFGFPQEEAVEISLSESQNFINKKNNNSIIPIPSLGRIFAGKNGEWMFTPDDIEIFKEERRGFPVIQYTPATTKNNTVEAQPLAPDNEIKKLAPVDPILAIPSRAKRGTFTWWPFSLAAIVLLVSFVLWQQQSSKDASYKVFRMSSPESRVNVKPLDEDRLFPESQEEENEVSVIDSSVLNEEEDNSDQRIELEEVPYQGESNLEVYKEKIEEPKSSRTENSFENIRISELPSNNPELGPNDCLVIVGAFASQENVEKMKKNLAPYGNSIITDTDVKLTRVGVLIPCDSDELPSLLERLKAEINSSSWVMRKK